MARPSSFNQETADAICEQLILGRSLRAICSEDEMPCLTTVLKWLRDFPSFTTQYARAKEEQADSYADEIVEVADDKTGDPDPASRRVRVDARKWVAAKLKPKKYGDRVATEISGPDGGPVEIDVSAKRELFAGRIARLAATSITAGGDSQAQ